MTFSITGYCVRTGMLGVAVATRYWAVGARVTYVRAGIAAMAVQAYAQPYIGYDTLRLLSADPQLGAMTALEQVLAADPERDWRQVGMVDAQGNAYGYTGSETAPWSGHLVGSGCVGAGNMLVGAETVEAMVAAFAAHSAEPLPERLTLALQAGHAAGGDRRGQQSAAVYVAYREESPYLDLRVDDHPDAIAELARLVAATRNDPLVRSERFAGGRAAPPVEEYFAHKRQLKEQGLA
jgi:uncharacterized Ntn-hydrolase superfamily protein